MRQQIRFDDSLPVFAELVAHSLGKDALEKNLFLRDAFGRLTFVLLNNDVGEAERKQLGIKAHMALGEYVDGPSLAIATPEELFDDRLRDESRLLKVYVHHRDFEAEIRLVDRRMVGADWVRSPVAGIQSPPRFVFSSLKGGVGRSTALSVVAASLSSKGRRVLAIDMDLEAPGLGNLILENNTLPPFGLLDYLVESQLGASLSDEFFRDLIGPSWLGQGRGRVDVIPAIGRTSISDPGNVLAKLARAYLASPGPDSAMCTFGDRMQTLLNRFGDPKNYDVILVDSRAGLHETTATAIVGLGADVLLFGQDQPQTFLGYELMLAHLASLPRDSDEVWRSQLHVVQSKAQRDSKSRVRFAEMMTSLLRHYLWPTPIPSGPGATPAELSDTFDVEWATEGNETADLIIQSEQPSSVIAVLDDDEFRHFDPLSRREQLGDRFYAIAFGELIDTVENIVTSAADPESEDLP